MLALDASVNEYLKAIPVSVVAEQGIIECFASFFGAKSDLFQDFAADQEASQARCANFEELIAFDMLRQAWNSAQGSRHRASFYLISTAFSMI